MALMPITDSMFLVAERREQPMHVGGLQLFTTPPGAGPDYLTELYHRALAIEEVAPLFRRRAQRSLATAGQWTWAEDPDVDLEHHFRHSALPRPGRIRELLALTSRLHGTLLDRERPLWEVHLIEGLEDGRFAIYTKMHHAMMDGVSALRLLQRSLSDDPAETNAALPWDARRQLGRRPSGDSENGASLWSLPAAALRTATDVAGIGPAMLKVAAQGLREQALALPGQAPRTIFNRSITGSRRFAADAWSLDTIKNVADGAGATVNDVVLAMCSGALRNYLLELDALPHDPLIAMTPVSLRQDDDDESSGNAVGVILCNLATDIEDPVDRLMAVRASMNQGKAALKGLSQIQIAALSALVMGPLGLNSLIALHKFTPPPFNLVISNIPGPKHALYWNSAKLDGLYPLSIPTDGQALNITVTSYNGELQFGLIGCRRTVPHLQRLLTYLDDSLNAMVAELV